MRVTKVIARVVAGCAGLLFAEASLAQSPGYPDRPVKIIVPFAAAGPTDVVARLITQKLSERFGQQFYTENMGGAGGNLGMAAVARSPADGYTILFSSSSYTVNPSLYARAPYDPDRDFAPVTKAAGSPNGLFVHPSIPAKSVKELVDLLKANPGKYTFASPGIGTTPHLSSELFKLTFALDFALAAASVPNDVTDEMFAEMRKHWSENQIVEMAAVVAYFGFLNRWNDTMGTPLEPEPTATGEKYLASHGWKVGKHARK